MSPHLEEIRRAALGVVMPGFVGTDLPDWLGSRLSDGLAGVWIFGHNVVDNQQIRDLTTSIHARAPRALVAADEEGGTVTRLEHRHGASWPGHAALGRVDDPEVTRAVAAELGRYAVSCGVDLVAAPDADVNSEATNPVIGVRSFGTDPALVSRHTRSFVQGLTQAGALSCAKHFPGHGATTQDSHVDLPRVEARQAVIRQRDLPPFAAAVEAGVDVLMTAHVIYPAWAETPATIAPELIELARHELGFSGVICTDALDMAAIATTIGRHEGAVQALVAGVDLICLGNPSYPDPYDAEADLEGVIGAIVTAVQRQELTLRRLEQAGSSVQRLVHRRDARRKLTRDDSPGTGPTPGPRTEAGTRAATAAITVHGRLPGHWERPMVVLASGAVNIAAGSGSQVAVRELASSWAAVTVGSSLVEAPAHPGDLVLVTDDRSAPGGLGPLLRNCKAVVHLGVAPPASEVVESGLPVLRTFGGGRASARAAAQVLAGAENRDA